MKQKSKGSVLLPSFLSSFLWNKQKGSAGTEPLLLKRNRMAVFCLYLPFKGILGSRRTVPPASLIF